MMNNVSIGQIALKKSIKDWEVMRENVNSGMAAWTAYNTKPKCALCVLYAKPFTDENCIGCLVMEKTGKTRCNGSPFWAFYDMFFGSNHSKESILTAIDAEIEFLKGLIDE